MNFSRISLTGKSAKNPSGYSRKKISFLLAESFQNIVRHGDKDAMKDDEASMFGVRQRGRVLMIYSSNVVDAPTKEILERSLNKVNSS